MFRRLITNSAQLLRTFWKRYLRVFLVKSARLTHKYSRKFSRIMARVTKKTARFLHHHAAKRPHNHLMQRWQWYGKWHEWNFHPHVHFSILAVYVVIVGAIVLSSYGRVKAVSDLFHDWDFDNGSEFSLENGVETSGTSARLKAQNYTSDANTAALFHFDEINGSSADDASSNNNDGTVTNGTFGSGQLNNAVSLNGTSAFVRANDSASLSFQQSHTLEAWTKFSSTFDATSHNNRQGVINKGNYQLYYDHETGKVVYEISPNDANDWEQAGGGSTTTGASTDGSWDLNGKLAIEDSVVVGSNYYVGLGNAVSDAEVWMWNGTTWAQIGGDGLNSGWADGTYEAVTSLKAYGTDIIAGLGTSAAGDAEVWRWNGSAWTKIGGDASGTSGQSWTNAYESVRTMTVNSSNLYVGLGDSSGDADIYTCNLAATCSTTAGWTKIGGDGNNGVTTGWGTGYEAVTAMDVSGTTLIVGIGTTAGDAEVWSCTIGSCAAATNWTKIGGDGTGTSGQSWVTAVYESVTGIEVVSSTLYIGLGNSAAGEAEVWSCTVGSCAVASGWTQIGGDGVGSSWNTNYEQVWALESDGTYLFAGIGNTGGDQEIWRCTLSACSTWTQIGGDGVGSGFTGTTHARVQSLAIGGSTLYAGITGAAAANAAEAWTCDSGCFNSSPAAAWTRIGGDFLNKSWGFNTMRSVEVLATAGGKLYAGTGITDAGNAQVWEYNGTTWTMIGGQGINSSWAYRTYEVVTSMVGNKGNLYVGLGSTAGDAEVWMWNGSTWTQLAGDGSGTGGQSWGTGYEQVMAMAVSGNTLLVGLGINGNDGELWSCNISGSCTNTSGWTKRGGDATGTGGQSWTNAFEQVVSLAVSGTNVYVGVGSSAGDGEIWTCDIGATCSTTAGWSKIAGDGVNSSWNTNYETVEYLVYYQGKLIAGLGNSAGDAEVWEFNGTNTWTQVGGDGLNNSWADATYERVRTMTSYNGELYAGLGVTAGDGEVWRYDGSTWTKVGGDGLNNGWTGTEESVGASSVYKGRLFVGTGDGQNADAKVWAYGNNAVLESAATSQDTNWHHIAATYDGSTMKIFIDGTENATRSATLLMPDKNTPLFVGTMGGSREGGMSQGYFTGSIDEVRISNSARSSFTTLPYPAAAQTVTPTAAVYISGVESWDGFTTDETANGGTITYRLSDDNGATWKRWDGSGWVLSANTTEANNAATINTNIASFPVTFYGLKWQAILTGNGNQQVTLNEVSLAATSDIAAPSANASTILGYKSQGGTQLNSNDWSNGSSPYFSWTAGTDGGAGIKGYCLYLGTDNTADPVTTKGLLGTSPLYTGGHCQFAVSGTSIDLATSGYIGTAMTTSANAYYLLVKAMDNAGNVFGNTAEFHFRFDNTPPSNPGFITAPSGFINTKNATLTWPTIGGQAATDTGSGVAGLQYRINSTTWYGDSHSGTGDINDLLTNDGSYATTDPPDFDNIDEGINTVYFRTWDTAGNVTSSYVTAALKVNTAGAPSEPQNVTPTPSSNTTNSFAFSWSQPASFIGDADNLTYCYTVNTLPSISTCTFTSAGVTSLGAGPYATQPGTNTIYVVARDESSNINYASYASANFAANTPSPGIPTNTDIVDVSIKSTGNWRLALTWDAPSDVGAGIASYKIYRSLDGVSFNFVGSSTSTTYIDAGLSQQFYYYRVRACDSTNNCGADSAIVSMLPTGKFTSPAALTSDPVASNLTTKKATITWATDRASDSKVALGTSSGQYGASEIGNSSQTNLHTLQLDNLSAGTTYYYVAKWTDEDGNTGTSQEFTFTTAPAPIIKEVETLSVSLTGATVTFTTTGASKVNLYYGLSEGFGGLKTVNTSQSESEYSFALDGLNDGTKYFYRLSAFDSEGGEYLGNVFSFNTPPRPRITNLRFQPVEGKPTSTQSVTWNTNVASTSMVSYSKVGGNSIDMQQSTLTTNHEVIISNLEDDSEYTIIAQSRDESGNLATSDRQQFRTALDTRPPTVSEINVESSVRGTGAEARGQVIISWKTDEPSASQVAYTEGSNAVTFNSKTAEDGTLTTDHLVIVSDLPTSKVYSLQPLSKDKAGNVGAGEVQSAIIGRANESVLTIILNTLQKVFGF